MSLPQEFSTPQDYFEEVINFFKEYQYLFNFANTDILVKNILDIIDITKLETIDVLEKEFDLPSNCNLEFLNGFFEKLDKFKFEYGDFEKDIEDIVDVPVSPKKAHEIVYMAKEIADVCEQSPCDVVVDFGSGLGYLDQLLYETTNLKVLGIECNENHYVNAKRRQRKYHDKSVENVKYIRHTIGDDSNENIERFLYDKFGIYQGFCITGLHACADLTIDAINLFLKMDSAKSMVLMPCCYHKMCLADVKDEKFKNFPLSECLRGIFGKHCGFEFLKVPFLRLAAQPPKTDESLDNLVFNLMARAVLQLYALKHNCKLKRNKRKAVKTKSTNNDFVNYLQDAVIGFTLIENQPSVDVQNEQNTKNFDSEEINSIWRGLSSSIFKKAAIFVLLQNHLQPVIENFILYDRLVYLKENGLNNCRFKKIFDANISPRCLALIAYK